MKKLFILFVSMFMFCCSCFGIQDDKILNDETGFVKHIDYIEEGETNKQIVDVLIKSGDFKGQEVEIENVLTGNPYYDDGSMASDTRTFTQVYNYGNGFLSEPELILITAGA